MILGIVFFFVLAANRGWLTPEIRVGLGSATSAATFCAGLWLKRRFGHLYSALAAVSAGIAGAYATLLAATALYEFLPQSWALVAAAAIAGSFALLILSPQLGPLGWATMAAAMLGAALATASYHRLTQNVLAEAAEAARQGKLC